MKCSWCAKVGGKFGGARDTSWLVNTDCSRLPVDRIKCEQKSGNAASHRTEQQELLIMILISSGSSKWCCSLKQLCYLMFTFFPSVTTDTFKSGGAFVKLQIRRLFTTHFLGGKSLLRKQTWKKFFVISSVKGLVYLHPFIFNLYIFIYILFTVGSIRAPLFTNIMFQLQPKATPYWK